jgi:acyl CoA:acetate/3-ketoacid CoA transferase alpha subunit/acyl CoA:acetate/3-ketoacid CoA transferase beta subunit
VNHPLIAPDPDDLIRQTITPRDHVHLAGTPSRPNALTYALCRVLGAEGHLTISTTAIHSAAHAIALSGLADRVIAAFVGDTYPSPRPNPLYRDLAQDQPFAYEAWSLLSSVQRLMAGALGLPYAVTGSLAGTDLAAGKPGQVHKIPDPARPGQQITLLSALRPDVTLVHGVCADESGNVVMVPPLGEGVWAAYAARRGVVASVERIIGRDELQQFADRVVIPGQRVLGLCQAPLGSHPQSLRTGGIAGISGYLDDYEFLEDIVTRCGGPLLGADWYRDWVAGPGSHAGYLKQLGAARQAGLAHGHTAGLTGRAKRDSFAAGSLQDAVPQAKNDAPATRQERLIVLGARAILDRVRRGEYDTVLAGIGASHMAAWLAAVLQRSDDPDVNIAAELGMYDFSPARGDIYLFSLAHCDNSTMLAGLPEILGGMIAANPRALGVLAAAEIDETGTINTSRAVDGRWLTGSGGANDIASSTDCMVIAPASPRRYVTRVGYRTSPGHRVREVVSDFGRFRRATEDSAFCLSTWLPENAEQDHQGQCEKLAQAMVAERTSWTSRVAELELEAPITAEELAALRALDPDGRYR